MKLPRIFLSLPLSVSISASLGASFFLAPLFVGRASAVVAEVSRLAAVVVAGAVAAAALRVLVPARQPHARRGRQSPESPSPEKFWPLRNL